MFLSCLHCGTTVRVKLFTVECVSKMLAFHQRHLTYDIARNLVSLIFAGELNCFEESVGNWHEETQLVLQVRNQLTFCSTPETSKVSSCFCCGGTFFYRLTQVPRYEEHVDYVFVPHGNKDEFGCCWMFLTKSFQPGPVWFDSFCFGSSLV